MSKNLYVTFATETIEVNVANVVIESIITVNSSCVAFFVN